MVPYAFSTHGRMDAIKDTGTGATTKRNEQKKWREKIEWHFDLPCDDFERL